MKRRFNLGFKFPFSIILLFFISITLGICWCTATYAQPISRPSIQPLTKVMFYLTHRGAYTSIENKSAVKELVGKNYKGVIKLDNVLYTKAEDGTFVASFISAAGLTFAINDPQQRASAAKLNAGSKLRITGKLDHIDSLNGEVETYFTHVTWVELSPSDLTPALSSPAEKKLPTLTGAICKIDVTNKIIRFVPWSDKTWQRDSIKVLAWNERTQLVAENTLTMAEFIGGKPLDDDIKDIETIRGERAMLYIENIAGKEIVRKIEIYAFLDGESLPAMGGNDNVQIVGGTKVPCRDW